MKILCVADHIDPLVYSQGIKTRFNDIDLILGAGDLPLEYYGYIVSCLNKPLYFVFGNHNLKRYDIFKGRELITQENPWPQRSEFRNTFGAIYLGDKVKKTKKPEKLLLAGLGGSRRYNNGDNQYTEFQMALKILKILPFLLWNRLRHGRFLDILLTHASPRHIHDKEDPCHQGFYVFRHFMRWFKPRYLLHGHIHLYDLNARRVSKYHDTQVINVYDHYVVEIQEEP